MLKFLKRSFEEAIFIAGNLGEQLVRENLAGYQTISFYYLVTKTEKAKSIRFLSAHVVSPV